jgi:hypothetical protein
MSKLSENEALIRELRFDSPDLDTTLRILRGVDAFLARQEANAYHHPAGVNDTRTCNDPTCYCSLPAL